MRTHLVHQRTDFNPYGDVKNAKVRYHNEVAEFVANVMMACAALGIYYAKVMQHR